MLGINNKNQKLKNKTHTGLTACASERENRLTWVLFRQTVKNNYLYLSEVQFESHKFYFCLFIYFFHCRFNYLMIVTVIQTWKYLNTMWLYIIKSWNDEWLNICPIIIWDEQIMNYFSLIIIVLRSVCRKFD